jgi:hypothetical protein
MAKIQNPQNERGETLATDRRVNQLIEERLYPIEQTFETYNHNIIPGLKNDINNSKIDVSNLDDDDAVTPLESFVNLNKINFVGRFVNVMSNEAGEITVYINEDNSLPAWDVENTEGGTSFTAIDANNNAIPSEKRYIYSPATGSNITGNTTYNYTAQTKGIHPLVIEYNGNPFNLTKSNYTFNVHYKINGGDEQIISLPLDKWIKADKIKESKSDEFIESGLYFRYKKLGTDIINDGKTPGNIEVEAFKYTIPSSALAEGKITGIKVSFTHPFAKEYVLKNPYEIYLWTGSKTATGTLKVTPNLTETISISGLKYINAANTNNTIDVELEASNLADGALKSNTISLATSGISVNGVSNWTLTQGVKAHSNTFTKTLTLQNKSSRNKLTTSISIPNPFGTATTSTVESIIYPIYGIEESSTDLKECFFDENKRLESDWTTKWDSEKEFNTQRHGAVVQFGKLYHYDTTNTNWKDAGASGGKVNYKNNGFTGESSYYRIFKGDPADNRGTTVFYIESTNIRDIFLKESDCELRVWGWDDEENKWEEGDGWIANKVSTPSNNGLAADVLEDNKKIKCTINKGTEGTIINKGIRMKIVIKKKALVIDDLTITF